MTELPQFHEGHIDGSDIQQVTEGGRVGKDMIDQMSAFHDKALCVATSILKENDRLAAENAELKQKIESLEAELEHMTGQYYEAFNRDECHQ